MQKTEIQFGVVTKVTSFPGLDIPCVRVLWSASIIVLKISYALFRVMVCSDLNCI